MCIRDRSFLSARMSFFSLTLPFFFSLSLFFLLTNRTSLFESLGFSANFLPSAPAAGERRVDSRPSSASKNCLRFFLSSIPRHRLCFCLATSVLTLIPGDPSTRVVASVTCRKCFSSMREKEARAFSRRIEVCFSLRFSPSFFFSFFSPLFGGNTLRGAWGTSGRAKGDGRLSGRFLGGRGFLEDGLRAHDARFSISHRVDVDTNRENFESDLTRREQRDLLILFIFFFFRWFGGLLS